MLVGERTRVDTEKTEIESQGHFLQRDTDSNHVLVEFNNVGVQQNVPLRRHTLHLSSESLVSSSESIQRTFGTSSPDARPGPRCASAQEHKMWMEDTHISGVSLLRESEVEESRFVFSGRESGPLCTGPLCTGGCAGSTTNSFVFGQDRAKGNIPNNPNSRATDKSKAFSIDNILSKNGNEMRNGVLGLTTETCAERQSHAFSPSVVLGTRAHQLYQMGFPLCSYLSLTCPERGLHFK